MGKNYSNLKIFHFNSKLKDLVNGTISAPLHVRLKPRNKCNHSCFYCCYRTNKLYLGSELFNEADEIPWSKMEEIISDFKGMGIKAVTFSGGGEPLSYSHIVPTIGQLAQAGIKIATLTNGSFLSGDIADNLSRSASWVRVSMDAADAKTYAKIRSVDMKEFDHVCENMRRFSAIPNKECELGVNFIVSRINYKDTYKFLALMKDLGVDHVKVSECVISTDGDVNKEYFTHILREVKGQIAKAVSSLCDKKFAIIDKFCAFEDDENKYAKQYTQCPMIQSLIVIGADMNVYTCQDKAYTKSGNLGSIKNMSFRELWYHPQTAQRLKGLNPSLECNHHCTQHLKNLELLEYMDVNKQHLEFV